MLEQNLFSTAFLGQIILVSIFIPLRIVRRMSFVFESYPPSTHPLLYPKPFDHYLKQRQRYRLANFVIAGVGLSGLVVSMLEPRGREVMNGMAFLFFMIQISPLLWIEASIRKELKLMRSLITRGLVASRTTSSSRVSIFSLPPSSCGSCTARN